MKITKTRDPSRFVDQYIIEIPHAFLDDARLGRLAQFDEKEKSLSEELRRLLKIAQFFDLTL